MQKYPYTSEIQQELSSFNSIVAFSGDRVAECIAEAYNEYLPLIDAANQNRTRFNADLKNCFLSCENAYQSSIGIGGCLSGRYSSIQPGGPKPTELQIIREMIRVDYWECVSDAKRELKACRARCNRNFGYWCHVASGFFSGTLWRTDSYYTCFTPGESIGCNPQGIPGQICNPRASLLPSTMEIIKCECDASAVKDKGGDVIPGEIQNILLSIGIFPGLPPPGDGQDSKHTAGQLGPNGAPIIPPVFETSPIADGPLANITSYIDEKVEELKEELEACKFAGSGSGGTVIFSAFLNNKKHYAVEPISSF